MYCLQNYVKSSCNDCLSGRMFFNINIDKVYLKLAIKRNYLEKKNQSIIKKKKKLSNYFASKNVEK